MLLLWFSAFGRVGKGSFTPNLSQNRTWYSRIIRLLLHKRLSAIEAKLPMDKQPRVANSKIPEPSPCFMHTASKTPIPFYRPFDQPPMKDTEDPHQFVHSELPIVVNPPSDLRIKCFRYPVNATCRPAMKFWFSENFRDLIFTLSTDRTVIT